VRAFVEAIDRDRKYHRLAQLSDLRAALSTKDGFLNHVKEIRQ
jgi:hypothetical protein